MLPKWKQQWLDTYKRINLYLKEEQMDTKEIGVPFNWIMDLLTSAAKQFKKEEAYDLKVKISKIKEEVEEKEKEKLLGEFAGYPFSATRRDETQVEAEQEGREWGGGPEPEEPNPYHGTYSEE